MRPGTAVPLVALSFVGVAVGASSTVEDFESGFGAWSSDHHLACAHDPDPCTPFRWSVARDVAHARSGTWSVRVFAGGEHDDGAVWLERTFSSPGAGYAFLGVWLYSTTASDVNRMPVLAYLGPEDPEEEWDLPIVGETNVVEGWARYCVVAPVPAGTSHAAFGFAVTWEGDQTFWFDDAELVLAEEPPSTKGCGPSPCPGCEPACPIALLRPVCALVPRP